MSLAAAVVALIFPAAPAPGLARSRTWIRRHDCERMAARVAADRYPGRVRPPHPEDEPDRAVVVCRERLLPDLRSPRQEAVLVELGPTSERLAGRVDGLGVGERTWWVEAHHPDGPVAAKLDFALQNALMARGHAVTDRAPTLAAADLDVLTRLPVDQAWSGACRRYHDTGALGPGDALLAVTQLDRRSTGLQAGVCVDGHWRWL